MNRASSAPYWVLSVFIAIVFALAQQLDGIGTEIDTARAIEADKAALASREWVARQKCGVEGIAQWDGDELTCRTHRNHVASRQIVAQVKP